MKQNNALFVPTDQNLFPCSQLQNEIEESTSQSAQNEQIDANNLLYSCYHNGCDYHTHEERDYERHWGQKHTGIPLLYPTKTELEKYGLKPQGKSWEV